jgi:hypothetical protein
MRRAKEVKVINRWRADDFNGEIPIGGDDEEMLGTAMKMANGYNQLGASLSDAMPVIEPMAWFAFYGVGGAVLGNTVGAYVLDGSSADADTDLKRMAFRGGYLLVSGVGNLIANGIPSGLGELSRAGGVGVGSALLAARRTAGGDKMRSYMLRGALTSYGIATISYTVKKVQER